MGKSTGSNVMVTVFPLMATEGSVGAYIFKYGVWRSYRSWIVMPTAPVCACTTSLNVITTLKVSTSSEGALSAGDRVNCCGAVKSPMANCTEKAALVSAGAPRSKTTPASTDIVYIVDSVNVMSTLPLLTIRSLPLTSTPALGTARVVAAELDVPRPPWIGGWNVM